MRLSLRTLLAFEDNIFDAEYRRELERRIPDQRYATDILQKIRMCLRDRSLGVPGKVEGREELDANAVAAYLDHLLPVNEVDRFEARCLENDVFLAELASSHQILSHVLGEPARISRECRFRCYALGSNAGKGGEPATRAESTEGNTPRPRTSGLAFPVGVSDLPEFPRFTPSIPPGETGWKSNPASAPPQLELAVPPASAGMGETTGSPSPVVSYGKTVANDSASAAEPSRKRRPVLTIGILLILLLLVPVGWILRAPAKHEGGRETHADVVSGVVVVAPAVFSSDDRGESKSSLLSPEPEPIAPPVTTPVEKIAVETITAETIAVAKPEPEPTVPPGTLPEEKSEETIAEAPVPPSPFQMGTPPKELPVASSEPPDTPAVIESEQVQSVIPNPFVLPSPEPPRLPPPAPTSASESTGAIPARVLADASPFVPVVPVIPNGMIPSPAEPTASLTPREGAHPLPARTVNPKANTLRSEAETEPSQSVLAWGNASEVQPGEPSRVALRTETGRPSAHVHRSPGSAAALSALASEPPTDTETPANPAPGLAPLERSHEPLIPPDPIPGPAGDETGNREASPSRATMGGNPVSLIPSSLDPFPTRTAISHLPGKLEFPDSSGAGIRPTSFETSKNAPRKAPTPPDPSADRNSGEGDEPVSTANGMNAAEQPEEPSAPVPLKPVVPTPVLGRTIVGTVPYLVFTAADADSAWQPGTNAIPLRENQYILTASPFRVPLAFDGGLAVEMVGDSKICILPKGESATLGIHVDYGRIVLRNPGGENPCTVRIQTERGSGVLTIPPGSGELFVDTFAEIIMRNKPTDDPPGEPVPGPSTTVSNQTVLGIIPKAGGRPIHWIPTPDEETPAAQKETNLSDGSVRDGSVNNGGFPVATATTVLLERGGYTQAPLRDPPNWLQRPENNAETLRLESLVRPAFKRLDGVAGTETGCEEPLTALMRHDDPAVRALACRLWGDLGKFEIPLTHLVGNHRTGEGGDADADLVRRVMVVYFHEVMRRDRETIDRLSDAIAAQRQRDATVK